MNICYKFLSFLKNCHFFLCFKTNKQKLEIVKNDVINHSFQPDYTRNRFYKNNNKKIINGTFKAILLWKLNLISYLSLFKWNYSIKTGYSIQKRYLFINCLIQRPAGWRDHTCPCLIWFLTAVQPICNFSFANFLFFLRFSWICNDPEM